MAYILHLIDAQDVENAISAEQFISQQRKIQPNSNAKFAGFFQDITATYPDLSAEDEDGDNEDNLWEEGLTDGASYGNVKELVIKTELTDATVITALIAAATQNGLKLYDAEGQVLYAA